MLPLLSPIQTVWPYLLVIWSIPFLVIGIKMMRRPTGRPHAELPYTRNLALFSPAERSLLGVLEQAVGKEFRIFGKVRAADIVLVKATADRGSWQDAFNRISAKHFDFVLCDIKDLAVRCAIEVIDKFHDFPRSQDRDGLLEVICKTISLPLVQLQARHDYSVMEVKTTILAALNVDPEANQTDSEKTFSVGMVIDPRRGDRPWTIG
jgi:Protein of unknown function (DUF2726)